MVANPTSTWGGGTVDQPCTKRRPAGIREDRIVHIWGGASAEETRDYLLRDQLYESHPAEAVLKAVMNLVEGDGSKIRRHRALQMFPVVPKMARRTLGLGPDVQPTVTGGLTFFGAPLNTYMTHAACAMVRKLREGAKLGLLYGQGGFVTKHHGWCCRGRRRAGAGAGDQRAGRGRPQQGAVPDFVTEASGKGKVESFTVLYGRERRGRARRGDAAHEPMRRALARVPAERRRDAGASARTWTARRSARWRYRRAEDGVLEWRVGSYPQAGHSGAPYFARRRCVGRRRRPDERKARLPLLPCFSDAVAGLPLPPAPATRT
jgi:acetyl-CoA C-acetyltransferase